MCFYYDDYDWSAEINEESHIRCDAPCKCFDCNRMVTSGEWVRRIFQLQSELCWICEDSESDLYEYPDEYEPESGMYGPTEHPCYFGESWLGFICRECCLLREAIYDVEEKEGCPYDARQPAFGELAEVFQEDTAAWGDRKYTDHALRMFPSVAWHRFIRRRALACASLPA